MRYLTAATFAAIACLALISAVPVTTPSEDVVNTASGPVRGIVAANSRSFKGIRFAAPITPEVRFKDAVAPQPWAPKVFDATKYAPGCPQHCNLPPGTCPEVTAEDCLFLNVFTPRSPAPKDGFPVMAWIHGGRFEQGTAGGDLYDATALAEQGVVVVTFNYRLNLFGFLATEESDGNAGFRDQLLALKWIQQNVGAFGGDKTRVTLFGQSAGGTSIAAHLAAPESEGLFNRAIIESNPWGIRIRAEKDAQSYGKLFAKAAGCGKTNNVDCLRNKTVDELIKTQPDVKPLPEPHPLNLVYRWTPVVDGKTILDQPMVMARDGKLRDMPVMMGSTHNDGRLFIYELAAKPLTRLEYSIAQAAVLGPVKAAQELKEYPDDNKTDARDIMSHETTDLIFACPARYVAETFVKRSKSPVYIYEWEHPISWDAWGPLYPFCVGYSCHASELPFVFGSGAVNFTAAEKILSSETISYWTSFAKSADANPNAGGANVEWPQWDASSMGSLLLDLNVTVTTAHLKSKCDFWDKLDWYQNQ